MTLIVMANAWHFCDPYKYCSFQKGSLESVGIQLSKHLPHVQIKVLPVLFAYYH